MPRAIAAATNGITTTTAEMQFLVNHVSHFLLITRLVDLVPDRTGRIVIVSSSASTEQAPKEGIMFDNLDGRRFYKPFTCYGQSKLATAPLPRNCRVVWPDGASP
jgi:retinol dehydrogenase-12/retinol dehydrogenase-13